MHDVVKNVIGGAVVGLGLALLGGCSSGLLRSGDDRPPIVVTEGTLQMGHTKEWAGEGTHPKRWKSKQQNGKPVKSFNVNVTGNFTECSTQFNGKLAVIDFVEPNEDEPRRFLVYLDRDTGNKLHPLVDSTVQLTQDTSDPTIIKYGTTGVGAIMRLDVFGGTTSGSCSFTADAAPRIEFKFVHD